MKRQRLNTDMFIERSKEIHGMVYDYTNTEFVNVTTDVVINCPKHGDFKIKPNRHLYGPKQGCKYCAEHSRFNTTDTFIEKAKLIHGELYDYSKVDYKHSNENVTIICKEHGEFEQIANNHLQGAKCLKCYEEESRPTLEDVIDKFNKIHKGKYDYTEVNYINNYSSVKIICKKHGSFMQSPSDHASGNGCPRCRESKGETLIASALIDLKINFKTEKKFKDCKSKFNRPLRFDFYLPDYNTCIEFDGPQHFKVSNYFGKEAFKNTKENDEKKNKYCSDNGIGLIRIKYTDKDKIPKILKEHLK